MTNLEFKAQLKSLNEKLASCETREEHAKVDSEINALVDLYRNPVDTTVRNSDVDTLMASFG